MKTRINKNKMMKNKGDKTKKKKNKIVNSVIILYYKHKQDFKFLMVRDKKDKKWMFPGGGIKKLLDDTVFDAAKREFYEETKQKLKKFGKIKFKSYIYHGKTKLYIGRTKKYIEKKKINTSETDKIEFISLNKIFNNKIKIKKYVLRSFKHILLQGLVS